MNEDREGMITVASSSKSLSNKVFSSYQNASMIYFYHLINNETTLKKEKTKRARIKMKGILTKNRSNSKSTDEPTMFGEFQVCSVSTNSYPSRMFFSSEFRVTCLLGMKPFSAQQMDIELVNIRDGYELVKSSTQILKLFTYRWFICRLTVNSILSWYSFHFYSPPLV